jgi:hypothetical protein
VWGFYNGRNGLLGVMVRIDKILFAEVFLISKCLFALLLFGMVGEVILELVGTVSF